MRAARRPREPLEDWLAAEPESRWQASLLEHAGARGYRRFHDHDSRRDNRRAGVDRGFPDTVLAGRGRVIYAELKREGEDPSEDQVVWLDLLLVAGCEVYLWRPSDTDEAIRILDADGPVESYTEWGRPKGARWN